MIYISLRDLTVCKTAQNVPLSLLVFTFANLALFTGKLYLAVKKFHNTEMMKTNCEASFLIFGWIVLVISFLNCGLQYVLVYRRNPKSLPFECFSFWFIFWYLFLSLAIFTFATTIFTVYFYLKSKRLACKLLI